MGTLQIILIIIGVVMSLLLILNTLAPREMKVEKSINLNASREVIYPYILSFYKRNDWSPWSELDDNMTTSLEGTDGTLGAVWKWEGDKNVGKGQQINKKITPNERVDTQVIFEKPFSSVADTYLKLDQKGATTKVTWGFTSKLAFPVNIMSLFMNISEGIGKDYQRGLDNLKRLVEAA